MANESLEMNIYSAAMAAKCFAKTNENFAKAGENLGMGIHNCAKANESREIANHSFAIAITGSEMVNNTAAIAVDWRFLNNGISEALNRIPIVQVCDPPRRTSCNDVQ